MPDGDNGAVGLIAENRDTLASGRRQTLWVGAALAAILVGFWPTLASFGQVWERFTYSHGYPTALLALWLLWRRRDALRDAHPYRPAALPLLGLSLLWVAAKVMNVQVVHEGVLPLLLLAWAAMVAGPKAARRLAPGIVVFLFAVPFWEVLTPVLQGITVKVSGGLAGAMGIPTVIRGELVTIPSGTFDIEDACAGVGYFIVGLLIATLYAHLFLDRWRTRIEVMALGGIIAIVGNWVRVTGVILVGHFSHMQSSLVHHHGTFGWVVFGGAFLFVFFPWAHHLDKRDRAAGGSGPPPAEPEPPAHRATRGVALPELVLATAVALVGPLLYFGAGALPTRPAELVPLPAPPAEWTELPASHERPFDWTPGFRDPDVTRATGWTNGSAQVYRDETLYREERQGRELIGEGTGIAPSSYLLSERVLWLRGNDLWVRQAVVALPNRSVLLVWYWYRVGGVRAVSSGWAKVLSLVGFFRRRPASEVISVSTLCAKDDCREALATLQSFLGSR